MEDNHVSLDNKTCGNCGHSCERHGISKTPHIQEWYGLGCYAPECKCKKFKPKDCKLNKVNNLNNKPSYNHSPQIKGNRATKHAPEGKTEQSPEKVKVNRSSVTSHNKDSVKFDGFIKKLKEEMICTGNVSINVSPKTLTRINHKAIDKLVREYKGLDNQNSVKGCRKEFYTHKRVVLVKCGSECKHDKRKKFQIHLCKSCKKKEMVGE